MRIGRTSWIAIFFGIAPVLYAPTAAKASVSVAVELDTLVKDAETVGVVTPVEAKCVWEDSRIYTYTRVKVEQGVAGELGTGAEAWVRTMGGVVGNVGQSVDGEAVFTVGKSSLLFLRKFKLAGTWVVAARAQGQYPVVLDEVQHVRKVVRSGAVGVLYPPRKTGTTNAGNVSTQSLATVDPRTLRLAYEVLHQRQFDDVAREIAASWTKLHKTTASDAKK